MLAATWANGHAAGLLHSWYLPPSSSSSPSLPLAALRRQPVSPNAAIDFSCDRGSGNGAFSMLAAVALAGIGISQTKDRKHRVGRGAHVHLALAAVDGDRRAARRLRDDRARHRSLRA